MDNDAPLLAISMRLSPEHAALIGETLPFPEARAAIWINDIKKTGRVDVYCDDEAEAAMRTQVLEDFLADLLPDTSVVLETIHIASEDWANSWKSHFHAERISERIIVRPSWEMLPLQANDVDIVIDPGMSFGTGQHGSTRGCLILLDHITAEGAPPAALDLGCGSGILSIALAKLGCPDVRGIDNYPDAIGIAEDNAAKNDVACSFAQGDLDDFVCDAPAPLVVANILATVLIHYAKTVWAYVAPGGELVLSGILTEQFENVCAAYTELGAREIERVECGEWTSGHLHRP